MPEAEVVDGMMYKPMESRCSIPQLIDSGNVAITDSTVEALTIGILSLPLNQPPGEAIISV